MPMDYDWIVVGSGFGGSVSALRLAEKGYRVAVLECGRRFRDEDFAKSTWNLRRFLWAPALGLRGILRMTIFRDVFIASGAGVGGGSLVYANTLYRAKPAFFANPQWPGSGTGPRELAPHYDTAERMLGAAPVPHASDGQALLREMADEFGVPRDLHAHLLRGVLRRAGRDRARPVLRRRGAGAHRLHALRRVHGRLPHRRQEHAGEELPLVRREAGRRDHPGHAR